MLNPSMDANGDEASAKEALSRAELRGNRQLLLVTAGSLFGILLLATFSMLYFAEAVFFPIAMAITLKLIFSPVVRRLNKWRVPNAVGAGIVVGSIFGIVVVALLFLSGPSSKWFDDAPRHFREVEYKLRSLKEPMEKVSNAGDQVAALTEVEGESKPLPVEVKQPGVTALLLNTTGSVAVGAFLTLVLSYFLLAGGDRLLEKVVSSTPEWSNKRTIVTLVRDIQQSISYYLFTMTCINVVLGLVIGFGMWLVGLPNPVLWGVMAACLNYIPYFGAMVGGCVVFLVGFDLLEFIGTSSVGSRHLLWRKYG